MRKIILLSFIIAAAVTCWCMCVSAEEGIKWIESWDAGAKASKEKSKPIFLLLTNPRRCRPCVVLEKGALSDAEVIKKLNEEFIPVKICPDTAENRHFYMDFKTRGIPTMVVTDESKKIIAKQVGAVGKDILLKMLENAAKLEDLKKKYEAGKDDVEAVCNLGRAYVELGRADDAEELLKKVLEMDPKNEKGQKVHALFGLARIDQAHKKLEDALKKFKEILKLDPEDKEGYADDIEFSLALEPAREGKFGEVVKNLDKWMKKFPKSEFMPKVLYIIGNCHYRLNDRENSLKVFKELAEKYPDSPEGKAAVGAVKRLKASPAK